MKPIPAEILAIYPQGPDQPIPGRGWWRSHAYSDPRDPGGDFRQTRRHDGCAIRNARSEAEEIDRKFPLPHPGFRVGQVWATVSDGVVRALMITAQNGDKFKTSVQPDDASPGWVAPLFRGEAVWFLVADPCCPHLAPWGPA